MSPKRQLAAIMFTDIEGYTALMQFNEKEAVSFRIRHKEAVETSVEKYNGKVIQYYGDGSLSVFSSAVEAVECAVELQKLFLQEQPSIPVRIGLHMGDVIYSDKEVIGDAVNIASRIESCAIPGSVLISDKIHDQIRSQQHLKAEFLDAYELKNVEDAMPIYAMANEPLIVPDKHDVKGKFKLVDGRQVTKKNKEKKVYWLIVALILVIFAVYYGFLSQKQNVVKDYSIAVLPFDNLSTDEDSDIFRDGITEDILTHLSKLKDLHVISRTSVMRYKDTEKSIPKIAKELNVSYILEGSIRKYGDKIRVTAQLIDAETDEHIWADNYDRTLTDIFAIQSEVSQKIVDALSLNISFEEQQDLKVIPTKNIEAYQLFLRGRQEADKRNGESIEKSIELYKKAIALDSTYAEAYAEIANSIFLETYYAGADPIKATEEATKYLEKAEKINPKISRIYTVKGLLYNHQKKFDQAKEAFEKAIKLSPNDVTARHQYATFFYYNRQFDKQLEQAKIAYSLDPLSFATASNYFSALTYSEKFREAEKVIRDIEQNNTEVDSFILQRLYMRLYMGEPDFKKAIPVLSFLSKEDNAYWRILGYCYGQVGDTVQALRIIDSIKSNENYELKSHRIAVVFAGLNNNDSAFYYLDTIRNKSKLFNSERIYYFDELKKDPRYSELLKEHGIED